MKTGGGVGLPVMMIDEATGDGVGPKVPLKDGLKLGKEDGAADDDGPEEGPTDDEGPAEIEGAEVVGGGVGPRVGLLEIVGLFDIVGLVVGADVDGVLVGTGDADGWTAHLLQVSLQDWLIAMNGHNCDWNWGRSLNQSQSLGTPSIVNRIVGSSSQSSRHNPHVSGQM